MLRAGIVIASLAFLSGCVGPGATAEQLIARATFDLECPRPEVQIYDLGDRVRGVVGCERRLSYVEICETRPDGTHCAWVINAPAWAFSPPADKRPPMPAETWYYTTPPPPRPAPPRRPPGARPGGAAGPPPGARPPPGSYGTPPAPGTPPRPEPFPTDPAPTPLPPEPAP